MSTDIDGLVCKHRLWIGRTNHEERSERKYFLLFTKLLNLVCNGIISSVQPGISTFDTNRQFDYFLNLVTHKFSHICLHILKLYLCRCFIIEFYYFLIGTYKFAPVCLQSTSTDVSVLSND